MESYLDKALSDGKDASAPLAAFEESLGKLIGLMKPFAEQDREHDPLAETWKELAALRSALNGDITGFNKEAAAQAKNWIKAARTSPALNTARKALHPVAEQCRDLAKQIDLAAKLAGRVIDIALKEMEARESDLWGNTDITRARKEFEGARAKADEALRTPRYFIKHADWLQDRFPDAKLRDVEGRRRKDSSYVLPGPDDALHQGADLAS